LDKIEALNTQRDEIDSRISFLGSDAADSIRQDEKNITTLLTMWSKFKTEMEVTDQQIKVRMAQDTANYCFFLNINTFFEDVKKAKMYLDTREKEKIRLERSTAATRNRKPLSTTQQLQKTVIEGKQPEEQQVARMATINVRAPTLVHTLAAPTLAPGLTGHATLRTAIRNGTIRPGGAGGPTLTATKTLNRWMTMKTGDS